ncbi:MAG: signal peptide peptidase SppA, partial [Moraxellaceae bacterium]
MNSPDQKPRGFLYRFFNGLGTILTWMRNTFMNIIFLFIFIAILAAIGSNTPQPLPGKFVLRVAPSGFLVDQRNYIGTASMLLDQEREDTETVVRDIVDAINHATNDKRVSSIVLDLNGLRGGGITKMEEIGQALIAFKEKDKNVIAISDNY